MGRHQDKLHEYKAEQPELDTVAKQVTQKHGYNHRGWSAKSIRDMARDVGMLGDYDSVYFLISEMEHSSARALDEYIDLKPEGAIHVSGVPSLNWVRESLLTGLLYIIAMARLADKVLDLGAGVELQTVNTKVLALAGATSEPSENTSEVSTPWNPS